MNKIGKRINLCVLILGVAMIAYYLALGIFVRFGQSLQLLWLLGGIFCIARYFYWQRAYRKNKYPPKKPLTVLRVLLALALVLFIAVEGMILSAGLSSAPAGLDYIIVLGAKVNGTQPSGALRNRIQVAAEYLQANPETKAVLSGGQGPDEGISEAQCMYEQLTAIGIDPARLAMEDKSTDTSENLINSRELIPEGASIGLVTNNFHIYRSLCLAKGLGMDAKAVPVATSLISMPHYFMREFVGVVYDGIRGNLG